MGNEGLEQAELTSVASCTVGEGDARNNPYLSRWARYYDFLLSVPPVGQIRQSEERTLARLVEASLRPGDHLLEIGPGTGRTTVEFAERVARVTAVEQSPEMVAQLHQRLAREEVDNCEVILGDFAAATFPGTFDVVALIGVLDYIPHPEPFLLAAARLARRELIFTAPHHGMLAHIFRASNRMRGVHISVYRPDQLRGYLEEFEVEIEETGLRTRLWRGMTLACRAVRCC
ncbi:MAG TPA: class I SAM-dependent methyltransferase [Armatimonadota bacterium]|jgi:precorrin-6B methylase 2